MYPWVGYWIKTDVALQMIVSPSVDVLASGSSSAPVHSAATTPAGGWLLPISTAVDGMVDDCTFLGMSSKTADAYQPGQDMAKPPAADMAAFVYTAAVEKGWGSSNGNYAVDLKPASAGKATWDLSVRTSQVGAPVTLTWGDLSSLPRGVRPLLVDLDSGRKVYMRTVTSYAFTAGSAARRLQVVIDPAQTGSLTVSGIAAQQAGGGTAIVYTLSRAAAVDVEIRNISGAVVKRVASGAVETAGRCQTLWNGRNEGGNPVPQGRYLVTVKARTDEGQETTAITSLMVGR